MKIIQIACVFPPYKGGIGNVAYHFAKNLSLLGHEVKVITPEYNSNQQSFSDFKVQKEKSYVKKGNAAILKIKARELADSDAIHLHYPFFGTAELLWLYLFLRRIKKPVFLHYHMDVHGLPFLSQVLSLPSRLCLPSLVKMSKAVTCASLDYVRSSDIKKIYIKHQDKFYEVPFGVDTRKFFPTKKTKSDTPVILFLGALDKAHNFKGLGLLLRALSGLKEKKWQLHVVGGGELLTDYKEKAKQLGLYDRVVFFGRVDEKDLPKRYQEANFFVFPSTSRNEAFGLVLLEAMASGLPVLASNLPGVRAVFEHEKQGQVFENKDLVDLQKKIIYFLSQTRKLEEWGANARQYVKEKYSWSRCAEKLEAIYKK